MPKQGQINTFQSGMKMDVDKLNHPKDSYRYSMNGRLIFNDDGTFSWQTEQGNRVSFNIAGNNGGDPSEYVPIGWTGQSNLILIWSVSPTTGNSEIGLVILDKNSNGSYKTLFNDLNDPAGDTLDLLATNQIEARFVYENDSCIRAYWVDGVEDDSNVPRTFTFSYDSGVGPKDDVNAYSAVSISVHSMNSQAEFFMGLIKYMYRIGGNLLTGVYQYTYRLVTVDGYRTPWYPMTRTVFITSDEINSTDWWKYEMEGSGLTSNKGNKVQVKGIDQRYVEIEVAYVYSQTEDQALQANIFAIVEIDSDVMDFDHVSMDGEPLLLDEIPTFFQGIRRAKTLNIKDTTLYYGNIVEGGFDVDPELLLTGLSVDVNLRDMRSDEKDIDDYASGSSFGGHTPPIAHGDFATENTTKRLHNAVGGDETYLIANDYLNYKGTQVSNLYKGYFRGETYRFGIVFFDKLGYQSFVYHLADVVMPHQSENTYTANRIKTDNTIAVVPTTPLAENAWPTNNFGDYTSTPVVDGEDTGLGDYSHLRIMGLKFSGIDVTAISSQLSGFMIVRVERDATILTQGLLYPCVKQETISRPHPYPTQQWADFITGDGFNNILPTSDLANIELTNGHMLGAATNATTTGVTQNYVIRPNLSVFYSPAYDFDTSILPTVNTSDQLKLVGGCYGHENDVLVVGAEVSNVNQYFTYGTANDKGRHVVQKMYYSKNLFHSFDPEPYPSYLDTATIEEQLSLGLGSEVVDYVIGLDLNNSVEFDDGESMGFEANKDHKGWGKSKSIFYRHSNFQPDATGSTVSPYYFNNYGGVSGFNGAFICNYTRPNAAPYGGQSTSSLERNIFFSTGHFQPVNNPTFATPGTNVYNEVEVWGGDCILDYHGFQRVYGRFEGDWNTQPYEYSLGVLFPLEIDIHHPMRQASSEDEPIWPSVGARPFEEYNTPNSTNWPNGLFIGIDTVDNPDDQLREEFNINECLQYEETIQFYTPKPIRFKDNFRFPTRWRYTPSKFYGDTVDTWRIFQVNDFRDLNGQYGEITSSSFLFDQIYSFQESAFGRLRASDRALVESSNAGSLTTGVGDKLEGIDYLNTQSGNQHQWSLFNSGKAIYWCNVDHRKICRFAQDGFVELSDIRQLHQWTKRELAYYEGTDNPAYTQGIAGAYDYDNHEAIFSFVRSRVELIDGADISVVSEVGANFLDIIISNNDLVTFDYQSAPNGLTIPQGHAGSNGVNTLKTFYICNHSNSLSPLPVFSVNSLGVYTPLLAINPSDCVKIFRNDVNDAWSFESVNINEISYNHYDSLKFNEIANVFSGFHSYQPNFFINAKNNILSHTLNSGGDMWVHNKYIIGSFYGVTSEALLSVISNEAGAMAKAFDVSKMNANDEINDTFVNMLMFTENQFQDLDILNDTRKELQENILRFPLRTLVQGDRMRGKHLEMLMQFNPVDGKMTRLSSMTTEFRLSPSN